MDKKVISYLRVSTQKQGRSGLGLEAQRTAIVRFAAPEGLEVIDEFIEVETGKGNDGLARRPKLTAALKAARRAKASIVVAKLDRLSRDVAFISTLMAKNVPFITVELGTSADPFMLHIYAALAEQERRMISQRTRAALQAAKQRGVQLGNPHVAEMNKREAAARAEAVRPLLMELDGLTTREIADELTERTGERWNAMRVLRTQKRLGLA
jgi:DNA invertase Pin-like site-specific DNA recombinase